MTSSKLLLIALMVMFAASLPLLAEGASTTKPTTGKAYGDKPKTEVKGDWAIMASVCKFTDDQSAKLTKLVNDMQAAGAEWRKANQEKFDQAMADLRKAQADKNEEAIKKAREAYRALVAEGEKVRAKFVEEIYGLMTPEQKQAWAEFNLFRGVKMRLGFRKIELTDAQEQQIKDLAKESGKKLAEAPAGDEKARGAIREEFFKAVREKVLTDEQRKALEAPATWPAKESGERPAPKKESGENPKATDPVTK